MMSYSDDDGHKPTPAALRFKRAEAELAEKNALKYAGITKQKGYTAEDESRIERAKNTQHLKEEAAKTAKARAEEDARATAAVAEVALDPAAATAAEGQVAIQRALVNNKDQPPQRVYRDSGRKDRQGWPFVPSGTTLKWFGGNKSGSGGRRKSNRGKKHKNKQMKSRNKSRRKNKRNNKTRRFRK